MLGLLQTGDQFLHLFKEGAFGSWGKKRVKRGFPRPGKREKTIVPSPFQDLRKSRVCGA